MTFADLLPDIKPWIDSIPKAWPGAMIRQSSWIFPSIQSLHLLALAVLGGAVLLPNLRLMGAGMTGETAASVEKNVRPWLWVAIILLAVTGLVMASVLAQRLYTRPAFLVKMIALAAALVLSLGVTNSLAKNDGAVTQTAKILAGIALLIWLFAVYVFGTSQGAAPGSFHLVFAGWLIVMAFGSNMTRIVLGAITAVAVIGVGVTTYGVYHPMEEYDLVMEINRWAVRAGGLVVAAFVLWEFAGPKAPEKVTPKLARLIGVFTIMAWVTVAAAGRWIGLGGGVG